MYNAQLRANVAGRRNNSQGNWLILKAMGKKKQKDYNYNLVVFVDLAAGW